MLVHKSLSLAFDPSGARDAVKQQGGGGDEPKNKKDLIAALKVMPEYADKEAELKRKKLPELQELWRSARTGNEETTTGEEQQETRS